MKTTKNRRTFVKKMSLFSTLCVSGISYSFANDLTNDPSKVLLIKADEGEIRYIGNTRKAKVHIKISKTSEYTPEMSLLSEVIPPEDAIPTHKHLNEEEFIFIQQGNLEIAIDDTIETAEAGDLIYVPKNVWHGFKNAGSDNAIVFFGYSPAGFEDYFRAIGTTSLEEDLGFTTEDWVHTNQKYGVVYRG